jgi:glycosyltransferase involved in cell wall biosynthesis
LSVVVPVFNEEESVRPLHAAISEAVKKLGLNYEIILVDDGSADSTPAILRELAEQDNRLKIIRFRKNYGQTPAMAAGIDYASGRWIVTMDGDLQNDPRDIKTLLDELEKGYDLAVGWRENRQDKLITRKIPSVIANRIIGYITGIPIKDNGCSLKAYRADIIQQIPLYSDMHRFIPAMASISGSRVSQVSVRHHARRFGESKYGLGRIYKVLVDLLSIKTIVSFAHRPLIWFALISIPAFLASFVCLTDSVIGMVSDSRSPSVPVMGTGVLFAALGLFLIFNGALAELVYRTGDVNLSRLAQLTIRRGEGSSRPKPEVVRREN